MLPLAMGEDEFEPGGILAGTAYRVVKPLGKGGMGAVYEVVDTTVDAPYVIKTLLAKWIPNERAVQALRIEARTLANLQHPNLVRVFTAGVTRGGVPYFVMDRLNGQTLHDSLNSRTTPPPHATTIELVVQMLAGLEYAHDRGIVHRDIKPENVFLHLDNAQTCVKLLDFGILKIIEDQQGSRAEPGPRKFIGTLRWASPEQIACRDVGPKSDLYSVGLILYYMLAGRMPFEATSAEQFVARALDLTAAPPISSQVPGIHPALAQLVDSAVHPDPKMRPRDAGTFASELRRIGRTLAEPLDATGTIDMMLADLHDASLGEPPKVLAPPKVTPAPPQAAPPPVLAFATTEAAPPPSLVQPAMPAQSSNNAMARSVDIPAITAVPNAPTSHFKLAMTMLGACLLSASLVVVAWMTLLRPAPVSQPSAPALAPAAGPAPPAVTISSAPAKEPTPAVASGPIEPMKMPQPPPAATHGSGRKRAAAAAAAETAQAPAPVKADPSAPDVSLLGNSWDTPAPKASARPATSGSSVDLLRP